MNTEFKVGDRVRLRGSTGREGTVTALVQDRTLARFVCDSGLIWLRPLDALEHVPSLKAASRWGACSINWFLPGDAVERVTQQGGAPAGVTSVRNTEGLFGGQSAAPVHTEAFPVPDDGMVPTLIARYGRLSDVPVVADAISRGESYIRRTLREWPVGKQLVHEVDLLNGRVTWRFV